MLLYNPFMAKVDRISFLKVAFGHLRMFGKQVVMSKLGPLIMGFFVGLKPIYGKI